MLPDRLDIINRAWLDEKKVQILKDGIEKVIKRVPKAADWTVEVENLELTPTNLLQIIRKAIPLNESEALCYNEEPLRNPLADGQMPISKLAVHAVQRSLWLKSEYIIGRRAYALRHLFATCLMRVALVAKGGHLKTRKEVSLSYGGIYSTLTKIGH